MSGRVRSLDATALIDGNVDNDSTVGNFLQHRLGDELRRCSARHQHSPDDQICFRDCVLNHVSAGRECGNLRQEDIVEFAQPVQIVVDDSDVSAHANGDLRCVCAYDASADNHYARGGHTRNATQQNSASTAHLLEVVRSNLNRHASRDFRHRSQQGQRAASICNRLVGDTRDLTLEQLLREFGNWSEVEIREKQLALAHAWVLRRDGLFYFDDHFGSGPNVVSGSNDRGSRAFVEPIFKTRTCARVRFDLDFVAGVFQRTHAGRRYSYSIFIVFNFFRETNDHSFILRVMPQKGTKSTQ